MKLYYVPRTRAGRPRWLLEELEVPYELVRLDVGAKENRTPEYLAIHPHGAVPSLVDGAVTIHESAAICLYLADKHIDKGLAPPFQSAERAYYYQWILYAMTTAEGPVLEYFRHAVQLPAEQRNQSLADAARARFEEIAGAVERGLAGRDFLLGAELSAADVVLGSILMVARAGKLLDGHPALAAYVARLSERPALKRSRAD